MPSNYVTIEKQTRKQDSTTWLNRDSPNGNW